MGLNTNLIKREEKGDTHLKIDIAHNHYTATVNMQEPMIF